MGFFKRKVEYKMKITSQILEIALKSSLKDKYLILRAMAIEEEDLKEILQDVKDGFELKIPISDIIHERFKVDNKNGIVILKRGGYMKIPLEEWDEELEKREEIITKVILEQGAQDPLGAKY